MSQKLAGVSSKITVGAATGALSGIVVWILSLNGITVPADVGIEISTLLAFAAGFFTPETAQLKGNTLSDIQFSATDDNEQTPVGVAEASVPTEPDVAHTVDPNAVPTATNPFDPTTDTIPGTYDSTPDAHVDNSAEGVNPATGEEDLNIPVTDLTPDADGYITIDGVRYTKTDQ